MVICYSDQWQLPVFPQCWFLMLIFGISYVLISVSDQIKTTFPISYSLSLCILLFFLRSRMLVSYYSSISVDEKELQLLLADEGERLFFTKALQRLLAPVRLTIMKMMKMSLRISKI
jgi:hypothetical protein